ncbi:hypothetical protein CSB93_7045 (plasmid) [Pseudomonas paraeruginosa]|uniref:Uncharacterized protein n=1 Tax=Pseudomonas paraeruginosa TaxID=2994495 RepID=A0A2R3IL26_9PSED|nr:hypothetical protein CSB93_7045 [Pseudomonas paraeruginosa]AWE88916.1 hypothetical protein CSC28_7030 [Pseudomonas paraeruginosa]
MRLPSIAALLWQSVIGAEGRAENISGLKSVKILQILTALHCSVAIQRQLTNEPGTSNQVV